MQRSVVLSLLALSAPVSAQGFAAYLIDSNLDILYYVDTNTGAATAIGSTLSGGVLATPAGLTWRPDTQTLWTIDLAGGEVGTIDLATGNFTTVFNTALSGWQGIDWDVVTQKFYLLNQNFNMYVLDPVTGVTTLLGASGAPLATGLESDPVTGTLYAIGFSAPGNLYTVDKTTGAFTAVIGTAPASFQGLSFSPTGVLYGSNTTTDSLYTIDPVTGATALVGPHGAGIQFGKGFEVTTLPAGVVAQVLRSGTGCGGLTQTSQRPILGTTFNLTVNGIPAGSLAGIEIIGPASGGIDLSGAGMPGCFLYVLPILTALPFATTGTSATVPLALPLDPSLVGGQVPVQAVTISPGVNALGAATSDLATLLIGQL